jgi:hypothetical protein
MRTWVDRTSELVRRVRLELTELTRVKRTNLTREEPGPRADLQLEEIELTGEFPIVGGGVAIRGRLNDISPLVRLTLVAVLILLGCVCVLTLSAVGLPMWVSAASLLLPSALFCVFSSRRRK